MKTFTKTIFFTFLFALFTQVGWGQTTIIDFEVADAGYTPSATEGSGFTDVFNRTNPDIGGNSTYIWSVEDINLTNPSITLDQIDVTGSTSFTFSIDMLAHHYDDWDGSDELLITYSIDEGAYQNLMWIQNTGQEFNDPAALDTDFDGDGDCGASNTLPALTTVTGTDGCVVSGSGFETFVTSSVTLSGNTTLDIKLQFNGLTAGDEGIYLDNIVITRVGGSPDPEPTNHPTGFAASAPDYDQISLTWTDAVGAQLPAGYLIMANTSGTFTDPIDGTDPSEDSDLSDNSAVVKVNQGNQSYSSFTGIIGSETYYFKIWPYTNSGATIDYKTDGTPETDNVTTPAAPSIIYSGSFEDSDESWSIYSVGGTNDWERIDDGGSFSPGDDGHDGTKYMWFYGWNNDADDWIISPEYDFSVYSDVTMNFWTWMRNSGPDIGMRVSTDYSGSGDPSTANWIDLFPTLASTEETWTASGDVDLSTYDGQSSVYIAFYYNGNDVDRNWAIDDYEITGILSSSNDTDSEVNASITLSEPANISSLVNSTPGIQVFDFMFTDVGATGDGLATIIDQFQITQGDNNDVADWTNAIAGAVLNGPDQTDLVGTVNASNITFASDDMISVANGSSETYILSIWLHPDLSGISDNDNLEFALNYTDITDDVSGSAFGTGAPESGDANVAIDISATELRFVTNEPPATAYVADDFTVEVNACDANGNIDLNETSSITLTKASGPGNLSSITGLTQSLSSGVFEWTDVQFDATGTYQITASDGPVDLTDVTSGNIVISDEPSVFISEIAGDGVGGDYNDEYIELTNNGTSLINLNNWTLEYFESSLERTLTFGSTDEIPANSTFVIAVRTTYQPADLSPDYVSNPSFNMNASHYLILKDDMGSIVDEAGSTADKFNDNNNYEFTDCGNDNLPVANWDNLGVAGAGTPGSINCAGPSVSIIGSDPSSDDFTQNSSGNIIGKIEISVNGGVDQDFEQVTFTAVSTVSNLDNIIGTGAYRLYYSSNNDVLEIGTDANPGVESSIESDMSQDITFDFSSSPITIASGLSGYFFITSDIDLSATVNSTIQATALDIVYSIAGGAIENSNLPVDGNSHTISQLVNNESDIITNGNEAVSVSSVLNVASITSVAEGEEVWQFTIRDGGVDATDLDVLPTIVNAITISQNSGNAMNDWDDAILDCALFNTDGDVLLANISTLANITVTGNQIQITGSPIISVPDEGSVTLSLRISIQTDPNDGGNNLDGDDFVFQISQSNVTADAAGSGFDTFVSTNSINGANLFDVLATDLSFVQQPPLNIGVDANMIPSPSVEATDVNGNRDLNFSGNISLSSSGTMTGDPISLAAVAGLATFSSVIHTVATDPATINLSASSVGLNPTGNSSNFTVLDITTFQPGDLAILAVNTEADASGSGDEFSFVCFKDVKVGTQIFFTDNGYERINAGQWGDTEGVFSITRTGSTLAAGTIITIESPDGGINDIADITLTTCDGIDGNWFFTIHDTGNFDLNENDQIWITQGGSWTNLDDVTNHNATYNGNVLYGWTEIAWKDAPGYASPQGSTIIGGLKCFTTDANNSGSGAAWVKFDDPPDGIAGDFSSVTNSQLDWIALINDETNWNTYSSDTDYDDALLGYDYLNSTCSGGVGQITIAVNPYSEGVWTGTNGTDWFDCANWQTLTVPDETVDVSIDAGAANSLVVDDASLEAYLYGDVAKCKDLSLDNLVDLQINSGDQIDVYGNLSITNAGLTMTANSILNLYGNFSNNESTAEFVESTGTVNFLGTVRQSINTSGHAESFYNLLINNSSPSGVTMNAAIDTDGQLTHTNGILDLNGNHLTISGVYERTTGELKGNSGSNFIVDGTGSVADLYFVAPLELLNFGLDRAEAVNLQSSLDIFNEFRLIAGSELADNGNTINIREVADIDGTHSGDGVLLFSNSATNFYALQGSGNFGNIELNDAGDDAVLGNDLNVNNLTLTALNSFDTDVYNISITGNWTNNLSASAFLPQTNTVTFNGSANQYLSATNGQNFYDLAISNVTITNGSELFNVQNDLSINGGRFEISSEDSVTVSGTLTNSLGASGLILKSNANGTASLLHYTDGIIATCERFVGINQWHLFFSPLSTVDTDILGTVTWGGGLTNPNYYFYDESVHDFWDGTIVYNPTGWTNVPGPFMLVDRGYLHLTPEERTYSLTGGTLADVSVSSEKVFTVTNENQIGDAPVPGGDQPWSNFDGWNLVGNPYTVGIDWDDVTLTNVDNGAYFYDGASGNYVFVGNDPMAGLGITIPGDAADKNIPANQAFFVKVSNDETTGTVTIPETARKHTSHGYWKKKEKNYTDLIRLSVNKDNYSDETVIRSLANETGVTEMYDGAFDGYKMFSYESDKPQLYSYTDDYSEYLVLNSLPTFTNRTVALGLHVETAGMYSIVIKENYYDDMHIILEDQSLEVFHNLNENDTYLFNQTVESNQNRFFIHFDKNNAPIQNIELPDQEIFVNEPYVYDLPEFAFVDYDFQDELSFTASLNTGSELPVWLSFNEETLQFYGTPDEIQSLEILLTVSDKFGEEISDVFMLDVKAFVSSDEYKKTHVYLYPNPTNGRFIFEHNFDGIVQIKISDQTGKLHYESILEQRRNEIDLSSLAKGIYFIQSTIEGVKYYHKIIIK